MSHLESVRLQILNGEISADEYLISRIFNNYVEMYRESFDVENARLQKIVDTNVWVIEIHSLILPLINVADRDRNDVAKIYIKMISTGEITYFQQLQKFGDLSKLALNFMFLPTRREIDIHSIDIIRGEILNNNISTAKKYFGDIDVNRNEIPANDVYRHIDVNEIILAVFKKYLEFYPDVFQDELKILDAMEQTEQFFPFVHFTIFDISLSNRITQITYDQTIVNACKNMINNPTMENMMIHQSHFRDNILHFKNLPCRRSQSTTKITFMEHLRGRILLRGNIDSIGAFNGFIATFITQIERDEFVASIDLVMKILEIENHEMLIFTVLKWYMTTFREKFSRDKKVLEMMLRTGNFINDTDIIKIDPANKNTVKIISTWIKLIENCDMETFSYLCEFTNPFDIKMHSKKPRINKIPIQLPKFDLTPQNPKIQKIKTQPPQSEIWKCLIDTTSFPELLEKFGVLCVADPTFHLIPQLEKIFTHHGIIVHGNSADKTFKIFIQDLRSMVKCSYNKKDALNYLDNSLMYETKIIYADEIETVRTTYLLEGDLDFSSNDAKIAIEGFIETLEPREIENYVPENADIKTVVAEISDLLEKNESEPLPY